MILSDGNILVRPLQLDDAQQLFEAARESIREMSPWLPWCHDNYAIEETREYLAVRVNDKTEEEAYGFGIFDRSTRKFLGGVGLSSFVRAHRMANLGYWVRTSATKQGAASKAARLVARFGFDQLGLQRIEILVAVPNLASQRVAEKIGAVREGVLRKRLLVRGVPQDAAVFSLIADDLKGA